MFAIVSCSKCGKKRIADIRTETTKCPFCYKTERTENIKVHFKDADQNIVRAVFKGAGPKIGGEPKKKISKVADPISSMHHEYENYMTVEKKMEAVAYGLTAALGIFTEEDAEVQFPDNGNRFIKKMIELVLVDELGNGEYRSVDPMAQMVFEYRSCRTTEEKLMLLADGLTKIKGSFTEKDIEELFPGEGEKIIETMVSSSLAYESRFGEYKAV